jgi:glyoxylase-like metal-dependent hydrolase (beta-lactamase superfamily II)
VVCQNIAVPPSPDLGSQPPSPDRPASADRYAWLEEGAHPVVPGIYRIPLPLPMDGLRAVNAYAIEAADGLVMIDSGWLLDVSREQLERSLASIGAGLGDIRRFLITHIHRDHYTQAIGLRKTFGMKVALGLDEKHSLDRVLGKEPAAMSAQAERLIRAGAQPVIEQMVQAGMRQPPREQGYDEPDEWISAGQVFDLGTRTLQAIHTPGHTRGHVVFADHQAGLLFAGDHVLPHITPSISLEAAPRDLPLQDYLESLLLVRQMPDLTLLPAHGPVSPSVHARVDELLDHHDARLAIMLKVLDDGPFSAYQVAVAVRWTSRDRHFDELDVMNQMLAVGETLSHLDLLVARGLATAVTTADGVTLFQPASATSPAPSA